MISSAPGGSMAPCQNSSAPASSIQLNQYTNPISLYSVIAFGLCVRVYIVGMITVRLSRQRISVTGTPASTKRTPVPSPPAASHHLPTLQFTLSNTTHTQSILNSTCTRSRTQPHTSTLAHNRTTHHPHRLPHQPRSLDITHQHQQHTQQTQALTSLPHSTTHTQSFIQLPHLDQSPPSQGVRYLHCAFNDPKATNYTNPIHLIQSNPRPPPTNQAPASTTNHIHILFLKANNATNQSHTPLSLQPPSGSLFLQPQDLSRTPHR